MWLLLDPAFGVPRAALFAFVQCPTFLTVVVNAVREHTLYRAHALAYVFFPSHACGVGSA